MWLSGNVYETRENGKRQVSSVTSIVWVTAHSGNAGIREQASSENASEWFTGTELPIGKFFLWNYIPDYWPACLLSSESGDVLSVTVCRLVLAH